MNLAAPLVAAVALSISACAPVIQGGPPLDLPTALRETARLGSVSMSSDWLNAEDDFSDTFLDEVDEELRGCMTGSAALDVRIHLDDLERAGRLETLSNGDGIHTLSGTIEFVEPGPRGQVVARTPIAVATGAQGRLGGLLGDRQMMVSEEFGRAVCEQVFGRNPRRPGPRNSTRG